MNTLSKREMIAAMAMQGIISSGKMGIFSDELLSSLSAGLADALLAELANGGNEAPKEGTVCWICDDAMAEIKSGEGFVAAGEESGWHNHKVLVTIL